MIGVPKFAGHPKIGAATKLALEGSIESFSYLWLIPVVARAIEMAIASFDSTVDNARRILIGNLPKAKSKGR